MKALRWLPLLAVLVAVTGLAGGAYRFLHTYPVGTGETRASPDGSLTASVMEWSGRSFWLNAPRHWFEYRVDGQGIAYEHRGDPVVPGPYFSSRSSHRVIEWSVDSASVSFVFPETALRLTKSDMAAGRAPSSDPAVRPCRLRVAAAGFEVRETATGLRLSQTGGDDRRAIREIDVGLIPNDGAAPPLPLRRFVEDRTVRYELKRESGGSFGDEITLTAERAVNEGIVRLELHMQGQEGAEPDLDDAWRLLGSARCAGEP